MKPERTLIEVLENDTFLDRDSNKHKRVIPGDICRRISDLLSDSGYAVVGPDKEPKKS